MQGQRKLSVAVAVLALATVPQASWAAEREIPLESCTQAEADAHGRAQYRNDDGRERLRFDIDDTTPGLIGATLDVFVDDEHMGSMVVREEEDEDEAGRGEGTLEFDTDDGDSLPTTLEGGETVDIRRDDQGNEPNGERIVSSECEGFDDSSSGGGSGGTGSGGGENPGAGGVDGLVQGLLGLLGLAP